jgi:nigerose phosphorylase
MPSIEEWSVRDAGTDDEDIVANGNRLLMGNGYLGYRGAVEEADASYLPACCLSGLYDRREGLWREPVNAPNALSARLSAGDGPCLSIKGGAAESHEQELDFRYGIHSRKTRWRIGGVAVEVRARRFASMADPHLLCLEYSVAADAGLALELSLGIDCDIWDINGPHLEAFRFRAEGDALSVGCRTRELGIPLAVASISAGDPRAACAAAVGASGPLRTFRFEAEAGEEYRFYAFAAIFTGLDGRSPPLGAAGAAAAAAAARGFDEALRAHRERWDEIWETGDVVVEGDDYARRCLRYSLYQLQIAAPRHERGLSVPARGLSGQTYKGAVFWDTEMFISPYFLYTESGVAKDFIRYRIRTLDGARRKAAEYGFRGAFYAWESQETGDDACSTHNVVDVFTGRPMRTYFRDKQVHISAAVAWSIMRYVRVTGDVSVLEEGALEVVLECARFYLSCAYFSPERKRYEILDVTGPDEYHERVNNDAYTNRMVRLCLEAAEECVGLVRASSPGRLAEAMGRLGFDADLGRVRELRESLYVPAPGELSIIEQFDGYLKLEDCGVEDVRSRLLDPREYWGGANGVAAGTRIIKQADVVLMLALFGAERSPEVKKANLDFYERRTEHGSSLSACAHSLLACEVGEIGRAYEYFIKTAEVDFKAEGKQYAGLVYIGGTHPAASGGAWMAAVLGFCGLSEEGGRPVLRPRLPPSWSKVSFKASIGGKRYAIEVFSGGSSVRELGAATESRTAAWR